MSTGEMAPAYEDDRADAWHEIRLGLRLLALDPGGIGGVHVRGRAGPQRDRFLCALRQALPASTPLVQMPAHITEDRLLGGVALAETLQTGRVISERGVLARADRGVLVSSMAERLRPMTVAQIASALDWGRVSVQRDSVASELDARFAMVALDEGIDDEALPEPLADRLGIRLDLDRLPPLDSDLSVSFTPPLRRPQEVRVDEESVEAIVRIADALGVDSLRLAQRAVAVARAHAALHGRGEIEEEDVQAAANLVLAPRATRMPQNFEEREATTPDSAESHSAESQESDRQESLTDPPSAQRTQNDGSTDESTDEARSVDSIVESVVEAAVSAMPADLLTGLRTADTKAGRASAGARGSRADSALTGRPMGVRRGRPERGARLHLLETLRAAAPWQSIRRTSDPAHRSVLQVRPEDFRLRRFEAKTETTVIFAVDASGSAAMQRLAEAKGAVEAILSDCYRRRDQVALIAFRNTEATLVLPPTRSLTRARRSLLGLAGGGATPLAAGLDMAHALCREARRAGRTPLVILMTDGRGNISRSGSASVPEALADAQLSARSLRSDGFGSLFVDTARRPRPASAQLAALMGATYLPMPFVDPRKIALAAQAVAPR